MEERKARMARYATLIWKACKGSGLIDAQEGAGRMKAAGERAGIEEIKEAQDEIDHRTEAERNVERLIAECRFAEAQEILAGL